MLRCVLLQTSSFGGVFRVDFCLVVTNVVNPMAFWLKIVVFWLRLTTFVTEVLAGRLKSRWFDGVCNVCRAPVAQSGPAGHGYRGQARTSTPARAFQALRRPPHRRPTHTHRRSPHRRRWGFCSIRRWLAACRRPVTPLMTPFPPFGVGQDPTGGGVAAKLQTTSAKNADNGLPWARWSAFWAQQCRTWCVVRM